MDEVPDILLRSHQAIVTGGGPLGQTTDMVTINCCRRFGSDSMVNVTSIGRIYDKNPDEGEAVYLPDVNASELIRMWGVDHVPGLNRPFEPKALAEALELGVTVHVIGADINDLKNAFEGEKHSGTVIIPE